MTIAEYIQELKKLPQDALVKQRVVYGDARDGYKNAGVSSVCLSFNHETNEYSLSDQSAW
jgi:hypothetical protein